MCATLHSYSIAILFARCMFREAHSHGAYQDFVREVGAPNILLTDNSQTQSGTLWTKTRQENITKQIHSVPYKQPKPEPGRAQDLGH